MASTVYETDNCIASCATSLFLPHFDIIHCGLLLNRGKAKYNLFIKLIVLFFLHFSDRWNKLDVVSVVTYLVILGLRLTTWIASESVKTNRAVLVAGYLYSFNTLCLTLRISHVIETFKGLGTIQIALFNVLQDVFTIIWQFIAAVFAFSVAITKIYMAEKSFHPSESNQQNL